jgi:hypothetical protein
MLIKSDKNLVPTQTTAHTVVIEDDMGNPIFAAMHIADGIVYSSVGEKEFNDVLKLVGIDKAPTVTEVLPPKT